jgi:hypothetical protein
MRLSYNILWFEDDTVSYNGKKEIVKFIVEDELGFLFPEPRREIDGQNITTIDYSNFDLILVDLNLAHEEKGTTIIDTIRNSEQVYTDVVFYSSYGEERVREVLKDFRIDGAYCADRKDEDFEDKVRQVIRTTVKKVQDLNNMRGLIMAETSDIDHTMLSIIEHILTVNTLSLKDKLTQHIFDNVQAKVNSKQKDFESLLRKGRIDKLIKEPVMFDSYQKILAIQFIIDSIDHELTRPHQKDQFKNSYGALKKKRDLLAHVVEGYEGGKRILKSGNHELDFTDDFCIKIRVDIKAHGKQLDEILVMVQAAIVTPQ